ncbi:MAG: transporter substrate-binding domain-containing protein [Burkholderiaceae bacterium]|nr:transporter substrate-binding domain-containing protein [Burkholderiaceae bacterium]
MIKKLLGLTVLAAATLSSVQAAELTGTLKKVKDTGSITVGYRESSIPFSYLDNNGKPIGYAMELCGKVVDAVRADLKMPNLKVNYAPVTSSNRIPLLENGTIDLECGSTTNSVARQKQVSFGPSYFVINVTAAVKKDSGINDFAQLAGKNIVTTSGTTAVPLLKKYEKTKDMEFREIYGKDHAESFLLMADGRAAAFVMDDILLAGQIANSKDPAAYKILPGSLRQEPYSMMLRKDDPEFKALVDKTIGAVMTSGEINKIYAKWFTSPIPPKGINLNFPETPAIKEAFAHPNDKGVE